ncbi:hypothetical protein [Salmonella phage PHA46]
MYMYVQAVLGKTVQNVNDNTKGANAPYFYEDIKMTQKRILYREVLTMDLEDCTLDEMLQKLNECKHQHPTEVLQIEFDCEFGGGYSGPDCMKICYYSEETDKEFTMRMNYEREKLEEKERKELGRLISAKKLNPANQQRLQELLEKYHNG